MDHRTPFFHVIITNIYSGKCLCTFRVIFAITLSLSSWKNKVTNSIFYLGIFFLSFFPKKIPRAYVSFADVHI